jgi:peptidoglycan/xylan/chitin deacetylase (PgdA/CDA1 family)
MSRLGRIFKNPLVIVLPIIALLLIGWQQYTVAQSPINTSSANIMPNAGFDDLDSHGFPVGWQFDPANSGVTTMTRPGYSSPKLLVITSSNDHPIGNTTLSSPLVAVKGGTTYFYKGFANATMPFDLLLRTNNKDGSSHLQLVGHYEGSSQWSTISHAFTPDSTAQSVQFVYSVSEKGELQLDDNYLEAGPSDIYVSPSAALNTNLIPNPDLTSTDGQIADGWTHYSSGDNQAVFHYITHDGTPYLQTDVTSYKNGEAKWQYPPIDVQTDQRYVYQVAYRSDAPADVVAEFVHSNGDRQFVTARQLEPSKDWTMMNASIDVPADAVSMYVTVVLHHDGKLGIQHAGLYSVTKPGPLTWQRPLVSLTFDDGWESAGTDGAALLNKYGFKGTFYLNPSTIDTPSYMTSDEVGALDAAGHELASHGYQHDDFTMLSAEAIDYQLGHAYAYFKQVYHKDTVDFATPYGSQDEQVTYYARRYYDSLRGTDAGVNTRQNIDTNNLLVAYIGKSTPLVRINAILDQAKATHGWVIFVYHRIESGEGGETAIDPVQFQQQVDAVARSGITVETVSAALQEVRRQ